METPNINTEDDEGVSKRNPSSVIHPPDILLQAAKPRYRWNASQLNKWLTDISFDLNNLRQVIQTAVISRDLRIRNTRELKSNDVICKPPVGDGIMRKDGCGKLYVKDFTKKLRKKLNFVEKMIVHSVEVVETPFQELQF